MIAAMRGALGRRPGLFRVPAPLLEAALRAARRADVYERLAGPLVADAGALSRLGWTAPLTTAAALERLMRSGGV